MSAVEIARRRYDEALAVREAYEVQIGRARSAWRSAVPGRAADTAKRKLVLSLDQRAAARETEEARFREWEEIRG